MTEKKEKPVSPKETEKATLKKTTTKKATAKKASEKKTSEKKSTTAKKKSTNTKAATPKKTSVKKRTPAKKMKKASQTKISEKGKNGIIKAAKIEKKISSIDISTGVKTKDSDTFKLTKRGLEILKSELKELKTVKRAEISERIRQARALGDLSENSEYEDAKREQGVVESRVSELENMLRKSEIVDEDFSHGNNESVRMGHSVILESIETKEKKTYQIVSVLEADPFSNSISNISPLGNALIGHQVGNVIRVVLPSGAARYRLMEIIKEES